MPILEYDLASVVSKPEPDPRGRQQVNYGKPITAVVTPDWGCMICAKTPSISIDASEGEYYIPSLCSTCLAKMFRGEPLTGFGSYIVPTPLTEVL